MSKRVELPVLTLLVLGVSVCSYANSQAELAKQSLNPVAALYSLPIQYNWNQNGPRWKRQ
ncbi:hypothetical protein SAMN05660489_06292 [Pseudomonas sp. LAMO17WK12:I10]|nr:hypothetical protein H160_06303 [Pseudomonas sp. LAMO17WK12:I9]SNY53679.1 hypothetical protein SAMN05660489_06292 [Pseudomonas sp. LAMO17WK12:I10]